jgi:hypothetical protein
VVVAALAGRRIDAADAAQSRFPENRIAAVRSALRELFIEEKISLLVCAAASGADLLALEAAQALGIRCRIVLPFDPERFRSTSVVDTSQLWAKIYDPAISKARADGDLLVLNHVGPDEQAYRRTTSVIISEAKLAALPSAAIAILVWDGLPRGSHDFAEQFRQLARAQGLEERVVLTK